MPKRSRRRQQEEQESPQQQQEPQPPPYREDDYHGQYYAQPPQGYYEYHQPVYYPPAQTVIILTEDVGSCDEIHRSGQNNYVSSDERFGSSFNTKQIRAAFIRKVYILLTLMLLVTAGICSIFMYVQPVRKFVRKHWWLILISFVIYLIVAIALICCSNVRRRFPLNIVLLAIFTLATALPLAVLTAFYDTLTVVMALGTTVGLCFIVTLFACQTRCDITGWGAYLGVALLAFCLFSLIAFIIQLFIQSKILHLVIAGIGTAIFSLFLMYDTQQIMGGKRVEISPEEYVYGAMTLYLDVIQIFCYMLQIFAVCRGG